MAKYIVSVGYKVTVAEIEVEADDYSEAANVALKQTEDNWDGDDEWFEIFHVKELTLEPSAA